MGVAASNSPEVGEFTSKHFWLEIHFQNPKNKRNIENMASVTLSTLNTVLSHLNCGGVCCLELDGRALTRQHPAYPFLRSIHPLFQLEYIGKLSMTGCLGTICVTAIKGHYEDIPRGKHSDHEEMFVWHLRFPLSFFGWSKCRIRLTFHGSPP